MKQKYFFSLLKDPLNLLMPLTLEMAPCTWTCILGESGVGKTTLFHYISGFKPCEYHSNFMHQDVAFMSQLPKLFPWKTVIENLCFSFQLANVSIPLKEIHQLLNICNLTHAKDLYPHQLSIGMQQRVCLLRTALLNRPIVLLDEPFSALDHKTREEIQKLAVQLFENSCVLYITHDIIDVMRLSDTAYILKEKPAQIIPAPIEFPPSDNKPRQIDYDFFFNKNVFNKEALKNG